ncbi:tryptophan-rich sensory protein [Lysinibacillus sp. NPDC097195]|uniref:tryptophan-rich sensory protein n=1 Tax=Lysinibacillus sp. NPDC097195 TaxID=3364141 RepID=UPI00380DBCC4
MKWAALASYLVMIIINVLASTIGINGKTTGEISNELQVLFTPAGYVFSIWLVIYVLLGIWLFLQLFSKKVTRDSAIISLVTSTCLYNIAWLLCWHYEFFALSIVMMVGLLVSLIFIYSSYPKEDNRFGGRLPFSIYLSWISVALMANISFVLTYYQWDGFGISAVWWANLLLFVATCLALYIRYVEVDIFFPMVIIWAFIGIAVENGVDAGSLFYMPILYSIVLVIWIVIGKQRSPKSVIN